MSRAQQRVTVGLLAMPDVSSATLYGIHEVLAGTRRDWQMLHGGAPVESPFRPVVVSRDGQPLQAGNGVRMAPEASFAELPRPDVVCITDIMLPPGSDMQALYADEIAWLRAAWEHGATLASACSGAMLLAATGLLDGCEATSHWAYCDHLAREHPRTRWNADRGLVVTGPQQRLGPVNTSEAHQRRVQS